jgi:hypothetical protein
MVNLNALLRRPVEYYEYPWSLESVLCSGQATVRSLFQSPDITYIFSKSMPRGGHRLTAARAACAIRGSIDIAMPTSMPGSNARWPTPAAEAASASTSSEGGRPARRVNGRVPHEQTLSMPGRVPRRRRRRKCSVSLVWFLFRGVDAKVYPARIEGR